MSCYRRYAMKITLIVIASLVLSTQVFASDLLYKRQDRMKSDGTIETTYDYGRYEIRENNGNTEMIHKNNIQEQGDKIREKKAREEIEQENQELKKKLREID
jgi:hypothetical protein